MKIITETEWVWDAAADQYVAVRTVTEDYDGPLAECKKKKGGGKAVLGLVAAIAAPWAVPALAGMGATAFGTTSLLASQAVVGGLYGAAAGALSTGSLKGAITGGVLGGIGGAINQGGFMAPTGAATQGTAVVGGLPGAEATVAQGGASLGESLATTASSELQLGTGFAPGGQLGSGMYGMEVNPAFADPYGGFAVTQPSAASAYTAATGMPNAVYSEAASANPWGGGVTQGVSPAAPKYAAPEAGMWDSFKNTVVGKIADPGFQGRLFEAGGKMLMGSLAEEPNFGSDQYMADARSMMEKQGKLADLQFAQYSKGVPGLQDQASGLASISADPYAMATQSVSDFRLQSEAKKRQTHDQLVQQGITPGSPQYMQVMQRQDNAANLGRVQAFNTGYGQGVNQGMGALNTAKGMYDQPAYATAAVGYGTLGGNAAQMKQQEWNAYNQSKAAAGALFAPTRDEELERARNTKAGSAINNSAIG